MEQCIFCKKVVPSGIKRFKQHLAGGYGDAVKCPEAPEMVRKDMHAYLKKKSRTVLVQLDEGEQEQGAEAAEGERGEAAEQPGEQGTPRVPVPSSGTMVKHAKMKIAQAAITSFIVSGPVKPQTQKYSKSVSSMLCDPPEVVVANRHQSRTSQPTLEHYIIAVFMLDICNVMYSIHIISVLV